MTDQLPTADAPERSARRLFAVALLGFVAFPGTLTALASGLVAVLAPAPLITSATATITPAISDPTRALPGITATLAIAALVALLTYLRLKHQ